MTIGLVFFLLAGPAVALPTSPDAFVGHYGESLRYSESDVVEADLHGETEVIRIHPKWDFSNKRTLLTPLLNLKPDDYKPENFAKYELTEIVLTPRSGSHGYYGTLEGLKKTKLSTLAATGTPFDLIEPPKAGSGARWPKGSFEIYVKRPEYFQVYTATPKLFVILTRGSDPVYGVTESDLADFVNAKSYDVWGEFDVHFLKAWLLFSGIFMLLAGASAFGFERTGRVGLSALAFSNGLALLGLILTYLAYIIMGESMPPTAAIMAVLTGALPLACWRLSAKLAGAKPVRVLVATGLLALPMLALLCRAIPSQMHRMRGEMIFESVLEGFIAGTAMGVGFGLSHRPRAAEHGA